jgi:hypothetical protein
LVEPCYWADRTASHRLNGYWHVCGVAHSIVRKKQNSYMIFTNVGWFRVFIWSIVSRPTYRTHPPSLGEGKQNPF